MESDASNGSVVVESQGICFLCLRFDNSKDSGSLFSLGTIGRYLKLNVDNILKKPGVDLDIMVHLCEDCSNAMARFTQLIKLLEETRIKLTVSTDKIQDLMVKAEKEGRVEKCKQKVMTSADSLDSGIAQAAILTELRKETLEKCSWKLKGCGPKIVLPKIEDELLMSEPTDKIRERVLLFKPDLDEDDMNEVDVKPDISLLMEQLNQPEGANFEDNMFDTYPTIEELCEGHFTYAYNSLLQRKNWCKYCSGGYNTVLQIQKHLVTFHGGRLLSRYRVNSLSPEQFSFLAGVVLFQELIFQDKTSLHYKCTICNEKEIGPSHPNVMVCHLLQNHFPVAIGKLKALQEDPEIPGRIKEQMDSALLDGLECDQCGSHFIASLCLTTHKNTNYCRGTRESENLSLSAELTIYPRTCPLCLTEKEYCLSEYKYHILVDHAAHFFAPYKDESVTDAQFKWASEQVLPTLLKTRGTNCCPFCKFQAVALAPIYAHLSSLRHLGLLICKLKQMMRQSKSIACLGDDDGVIYKGRTCLFCFFYADNNKSWKEHTLSCRHLKQNDFECVCGLTFNSYKYLEQHRKRYCPAQQNGIDNRSSDIKCPHCDATALARRPQDLKYHILKVHPDLYFSAYKDDTITDSDFKMTCEQFLPTFMEIDHSIPPSKPRTFCHLCLMRGKAKKTVYTHLPEKHLDVLIPKLKSLLRDKEGNSENSETIYKGATCLYCFFFGETKEIWSEHMLHCSYVKACETAPTVNTEDFVYVAPRKKSECGSCGLWVTDLVKHMRFDCLATMATPRKVRKNVGKKRPKPRHLTKKVEKEIPPVNKVTTLQLVKTLRQVPPHVEGVAPTSTQSSPLHQNIIKMEPEEDIEIKMEVDDDD